MLCFTNYNAAVPYITNGMRLIEHRILVQSDVVGLAALYGDNLKQRSRSDMIRAK